MRSRADRVQEPPAPEHETPRVRRPAPAVADILRAQQTHGNAWVARMVRAGGATRKRERDEEEEDSDEEQATGAAPLPQQFRPLFTEPGAYAGIRDELLWQLPAGDFFRLRAISRAYNAQIRTLLLTRAPTLAPHANLLLGRCPALRYERMVEVARQWDALAQACGTPAALAAAIAFVPNGLTSLLDFQTLVLLVRAHPPPRPLTLEQARRALTMQRPRGKAPVDPTWPVEDFWTAVLAPPSAEPSESSEPRGRKRRATEPKSSNNAQARVTRQNAALAEVGRTVASNPRIDGLETLATQVHNPLMSLANIQLHRAGKKLPAGVKGPDTQATTCIALFRGTYLLARQNNVAVAPATFAAACTTLGLPAGPTQSISNTDLQLSVESSGLHGESMIIRYLWLTWLAQRGHVDEEDDEQVEEGEATQAELYVFYDWLKRTVVMGASQGICWDCAGNLALFGVPHASTPSLRPSPMWVDPITQEQWGSDTNRADPEAIRRQIALREKKKRSKPNPQGEQ